jgi:hypothetical protein
MINGFTINNIDGVNTYDINTDIVPLHDFDVTVAQRTDTSRDKSQQHGVNATHTLRGGMEIHVEGDIFGNDSTDYITNRKAFLLALFGDPNVPVVLTDKKLGTVVIDFVGETETWQTDFTITLFSAPVQGLSPSRTPFALTLFSWTPWFVGTTSGDKYYWS